MLSVTVLKDIIWVFYNLGKLCFIFVIKFESSTFTYMPDSLIRNNNFICMNAFFYKCIFVYVNISNLVHFYTVILLLRDYAMICNF